MKPICLSEIIKVYQFILYPQSWYCEGKGGHVLAYKLYGQTDHICGGNFFRHTEDTVMYYNDTDTFQVVNNNIPQGKRHGREQNGFCIAVHFEKVQKAANREIEKFLTECAALESY